jgi:glycosyltransferase involved in cell wall biosynthesis
MITEANRTAIKISYLPQPSGYIMHNRASVSVVIPTLNEAENLPYVMPRIPAWVDEVVLVDGHSTDGTVQVARQLRPDVKVVMEKRRGKGIALQTGFAAATGDIIVMLDADGSTDPAEIPAYVGALLAGADFAKGSRFLQGGGTADMEVHRKMGNWGFVMLVRLLFGGTYSDLCYGYNAFWARVLPLLDLDGNGFEIETMMNVRALRAGLAIAEVPSFEDRRVHGLSNLRAIPDGWRVLKTIFKEWLRKPTARALKREGKITTNDTFTPAMRLLFEEARQLSRSREKMSEQAYIRAMEAIKHAYVTLLKLETDSEIARLRQKRLSEVYGDDTVWNFLEADSQVPQVS